MTEELFAKDGKPDFSYRNCDTVDELAKYINELVAYPHDYNTSGYAITKALRATEMLMAHLLGTTGFQHGYARLAFLKEEMGSKSGVAVIDFDNLMYPQYDILAKVAHMIKEHKKSKYFKNVVRERIAENKEEDVHPAVWARWQELVGGKSS